MRTLLLSVSLVGASAFAFFANANTTEYKGEASYEWHQDPPLLTISGDAAVAMKRDFSASAKGKEMTVAVECSDNPLTKTSDCFLQFPTPGSSVVSAKEVSLSDRAIALVQAVYLGDLADASYEAAKPVKDGSVLVVVVTRHSGGGPCTINVQFRQNGSIFIPTAKCQGS